MGQVVDVVVHSGAFQHQVQAGLAAVDLVAAVPAAVSVVSVEDPAAVAALDVGFKYHASCICSVIYRRYFLLKKSNSVPHGL